MASALPTYFPFLTFATLSAISSSLVHPSPELIVASYLRASLTTWWELPHLVLCHRGVCRHDMTLATSLGSHMLMEAEPLLAGLLYLPSLSHLLWFLAPLLVQSNSVHPEPSIPHSWSYPTPNDHERVETSSQPSQHLPDNESLTSVRGNPFCYTN